MHNEPEPSEHSPSAPPTTPDRLDVNRPGGSRDDLRTYHTVAETIGGVPSIRWKDSLFQGIFVVFGAAIGGIVGHTRSDTVGLILGIVAGLIASVILSGLFLMVLGLVRASKPK